ncbi:MAG: AraC family transcriptional regulator [Myxococcales bacterium]|nr:AraC family transcriptional regulator [Myxococcales bacterium]
MQQRVSRHTLLLILRSLARRTERSVPEVAGRLAVDPSVLSDRDATVPKDQMDALWSRALSLSEDQGFGLELPRELSPGSRLPSPPPTATSQSSRWRASWRWDEPWPHIGGCPWRSPSRTRAGRRCSAIGRRWGWRPPSRPLRTACRCRRPPNSWRCAALIHTSPRSCAPTPRSCRRS